MGFEAEIQTGSRMRPQSRQLEVGHAGLLPHL